MTIWKKEEKVRIRMGKIMKKQYYLIQIFLMFCISCGVQAGFIGHDIAYILMKQGELENFKEVIVSNPKLAFSGLLCQIAFDEKKYEYAKFLIDRGVLQYSYKKGYNPLNWAGHSGNLDMVKYIVNRIDKKYLNIPGYSPAPSHLDGELPLGASIEHSDIVEYLLNAGAIPEKKDLNGRNALFYAIGILWSPNFIWTPEMKKSTFLILNACKDKKKLIQDFDSSGNNVFHFACKHGNTEFIDYCLKNQLADVNTSNQFGSNPLHIVCWNWPSKIKLINLLLKYGANVNEIAWDGTVPLSYAIKNKKAVELLLKKNADVNVIDYEGQTPLDRAIEISKKTENKEVVQLLRKNGAKTAKELQAMKNNPQKHAD